MPQVPPQLPAAAEEEDYEAYRRHREFKNKCLGEDDDSSDEEWEEVCSVNSRAEAGNPVLWVPPVLEPLSKIVSHHALNPAFSFETERKEWKDVAEGDVLVRTWKGDYFDTHSFYWVVKKNLKSIWVQALDGDDAHYVGQRERVTDTVAQRWSQYYFKGGHEAFMKRVVKIAAQL